MADYIKRYVVELIVKGYLIAKRLFLLIGLVFLGLFFVSPKVSAYSETKPMMIFYLWGEDSYKQPGLTKANIYGCKDKLCNGKGQTELLVCDEEKCRLRYYNSDYQYYKVIFNFSEKILESNIFVKKNEFQDFDLTIKKDKLIIRKSSVDMTNKDTLLILSIIIGAKIIISLLFLRLNKKELSVLKWIILSNLLSLLIVCYLPSLIGIPGIWGLVLLLGIVISFEYFFVYYFSRNYLGSKKTFVLVLLNNLIAMVVLFSFLMFIAMKVPIHIE